MRFPKEIPVYGDLNYRGECPSEFADHKTAIGMIKERWPELLKILVHPKNEGKRTGHAAMIEKSMGGLNKGASDINIPGNPSFICEIKRQDHTQSSWGDGQIKYLLNCQKMGAFVCVALGWRGAIEAVEAWDKVRVKQ